MAKPIQYYKVKKKKIINKIKSLLYKNNKIKLIKRLLNLKNNIYFLLMSNGNDGNGTPLQYSCLENPMDGGAWKAAVHGVAEGLHFLSELLTTEQLHFHFLLSCIGEGNDNPLQCSCLENPRDGGAWWAAIYGVAQSRTWLKWLSSSSNGNDSVLGNKSQSLQLGKSLDAV